MLNKYNLSQIIQNFNLSLINDNNKYIGTCPIHENADNPTAFCIYKNTGIWRCFSHSCHIKYGQSLNNLIKILSIKTGIKISSNNIIKVCKKSKEEKQIYNEKLMFIRQTALLKKSSVINSRENFRRNAIIPSEYYLGRNFTKEILDKYDVGLYKNEKHQFYGRVVVPIYNTAYTYIIGYTARSIFPRCLVCGYHHELNRKCPDKLDFNKNCKWEHSRGFIKEKCLYNMWFAEPYLKDSIIICEGPSHCWKLVEAGFENCVAIFGSSLSKYQANLIRKTNVNKIILPYDNDEAGINVSQQIKQELGNQYEYKIIDLPQGDIADLTIKEIQDLLK